MTLILVSSICIRLVAIAWSLVLLRRVRDWRMIVMTLMLALMATRQFLTLRNTWDGWTFDLTGAAAELPGLVVSVLALMVVVFLERLLRQRQEATARLEDAAANLDMTQRLAHIGHWEFDPATMRIAASPELCRILGFDPASSPFPVEWIINAAHPEDMEAVAERVRRAQEGDVENVWLEFRIRRNGDEERIVFGRADTARPEGRTLGTIQDITELRQAEKQLRESRQILRDVLDTIPVRVFWKDLNGVYLGCNQLFAEDAGRDSPDDMIGDTDENMGWAEQAELYRSDDREVTKSGIPKLNYEEPQTTPAGERIWLNTSKVPLRDTAGSIYGVLGTYEDITDRKRAEEERLELAEQMQHAQKLESLGVLAGGIAHDFNNLLTGILGGAELAELDLPPDSPIRPQIDAIRRSALHATELTRQMLAYSGKGRFVVEPINIENVVREMAHLLEATLPKSVVLKTTFATDLPAVEADASQIQQVIMNLIINAGEAIGDNEGTVTVATGQRHVDAAHLRRIGLARELAEGAYVYLTVTDTGEGMDAETVARIFEPFYTTKVQGRGLGLAAVLGIVRGHNGALTVDSTPGQGTTFSLLLPASREEAHDTQRGRRSPTDGWTGSGTVLIVDDEAQIRDYAEQALTRLGFSVMTARDGREGVDVFRAHADDIVLVILDLTMPHMDGAEAFALMRDVKPDIPVILSSGYNEQDTTSRFVGQGLAGFIQKPYKVDTITTAVRNALAPQEPDG